ncbi:MAG: shikimate dehydrogenase [Alphaproteobacteria bacterium]|nr:MAG: shikimate dehydrogenase [Alphaproteobacteria bacterium]
MGRQRIIRTGLIGAHIGASRFGAALEMLARSHGLRLDFRSIDTAGQAGFDICATLAALAGEGRTGTAITHPHKRKAAGWAGLRLAPEAARIGAINTVVFTGEGAVGHNTDYSGFLGAWRAARGDERPGRVAMAGAGGVAAAVGHALRRLGADDIAIWDLAEGAAEALARSIGAPARAVPVAEAAAAVAAAEGVVNCTPLGMHHHPGDAFAGMALGDAPGGRRWAFDAVYTPTDTPFLQRAAAAGLQTISGFELFRHMAIASFEQFSGIRPEESAALERLAQLRPKEAAA